MISNRYLAYLALLAACLSPLLVLVKRHGSGTEVETSEVRARTISSTVLASGTFLYADQIRVSPEVLGVVDKVLVSEGQAVAAGTPLVSIRADTYESEVAQRRAAMEGQIAAEAQRDAELANSRTKLRRIESLSTKGFVTKAALDDARADVTSGEAGVSGSRAGLHQSAALLRLAEQNLHKTSIVSTRAGQVVDITARAGETVVPSSVNISGSSLMTIADTTQIIAEINVDEADAGRIRRGQRVSLTPTAYPERRIPGIVLGIALSPGRQDVRELGLTEVQTSQARTFSVKVRIPMAYAEGLRAGMTCRAEIHWRSTKTATSIPVEAVRSGDGTTRDTNEHAFVFLDRNGTVRRKSIRLGPSDDRFQAVQSGLASGDLVVVGPAKTLASLQDGERVRSGTSVR